ncbi:MAG: hypothetical protein Q9223_002147 [Gallowayella weberi]
MEAPSYGLDPDMAAMTIAGTNMESAVARFKRLKSAREGSSVISPPPSDNDAEVSSKGKSFPGRRNGTLPSQATLAQASEVKIKQLLPPSVKPVSSQDRRSFETIDSALGESLSDADVPRQNSPIHDQNVPTYPDQYGGVSEVHLQMSTAMPSSIGTRRASLPGSLTKEHGVFPKPQTGDSCDQSQPHLASEFDTKMKKSVAPDNGNRSGKISEAMKASWARRRKSRLGDPRHTISTGKASTEKRPDKDISEWSISKDSPSDGHRRRLFQGQHAIRTGSGTRLSASTSRQSSSTDATPHHAILHDAVYPQSIPKQLAPDTSGGLEWGDPPPICKGEVELINIFRTCVQPAIDTSIYRYRESVLSFGFLLAMGKRVANDTMTEKFVDFLRKGNYRLDRPQKKLIRKYVKKNFAASVKLAVEEMQAETLKVQPTQRSPQIGSKHPVATNEAQTQHYSPAIGSSAPSLYGHESVRGREHSETVVGTHNIGQRIGKAEILADSTAYAEADAIAGLSNCTGSSRLKPPSTELNNIVRPRACKLCRDNHLKCVPLVSDFNWTSTLYPSPSPDPSSLQRSSHRPKWSCRTAFSPELELATANATLSEPGSAGVPRPYKSLTRGHFDFIRAECLSILHTLDSLDQVPTCIYPVETTGLYQQIKTRLGQPSEDRLTTIVKAVSMRSDPVLAGRKKKNIRAFLLDIRDDIIPPHAQPKFAKPDFKVAEVLRPKATISSLLRNRELGVADDPSSVLRKGFGNAGLQGSLEIRIAEDIRPWKSWKGASSDVVTVAWAPDSLSYAAGAAAQSDDNDLQYNRPNNLLFGQLEPNSISELPDHCIDRPRPETIDGGPNSDPNVYRACDPMVYKTVTTVQFSPCGGILYTASHDRTAKVWDVNRPGLPNCIGTLHHEADVTGLEVSTHHPQLFATAAKSIGDSIRLYRPLEELSHGELQPGFDFISFTSSRAVKNPDWSIYPECVRFGVSPGSKHLLLGGFQEWADQDFSPARQGHICLWDIHTAAKVSVQPHVSAIFAAAWHPQENLFITGGAPGSGARLSYPKTTQSVVRLYDPRIKNSYTAEFECPGTDMQDVTFHPFSSYVTAGCTNGTTYVWDCRMPDYIMHRLEHGDPLLELAANEDGLPYIRHRERFDTGIMLSIWGRGASLFYTGSSDGVVKSWDIFRAPEDVHVRDVVQLPAGVQSGALSPDGMNMLVGDAVGGIHILSATPTGLSAEDNSAGYHPDPIPFVAADKKNDSAVEEVGTEGIDEANKLLRSGRLVVHPSFGVGKGPNYQSFFAEYARWQNSNSGYNELRPEIDRQQAFNADGVEQPAQSSRIRNVISARRSQMAAATEEVKPLAISLGPPTRFVANRCATPKPPPRSTTLPNTLEAVCASPKASSEKRSFATPKGSSLARSKATKVIDLETYVSPTPTPTPSKKRKHNSQDGSPSRSPLKRVKVEATGSKPSPSPSPFRARSKSEVIDLTGDDDLPDSPSKNDAAIPDRKSRPYAVSPLKGQERIAEERAGDGEEEGNLLSFEGWVDEDYWWPEGC